MAEPTDSWTDLLKSPRIIVTIILVVLALVFILENSGKSDVRVLFWTVDWPLWLWTLLLFAGGFVVGSMFPWFHRRATPGPNASSSPPRRLPPS
jgi:lipopolysaccharide assembly LapA-like protein